MSNSDKIFNHVLKIFKDNNDIVLTFNYMNIPNELGKNLSAQQLYRLLFLSEPFEKHTDTSMKLSQIGVHVLTNYRSWHHYIIVKTIDKYVFQISSVVASVFVILLLIYSNSLNDKIKSLESEKIEMKTDILNLERQYLLKSNQLDLIKTYQHEIINS